MAPLGEMSSPTQHETCVVMQVTANEGAHAAALTECANGQGKEHEMEDDRGWREQNIHTHDVHRTVILHLSLHLLCSDIIT